MGEATKAFRMLGSTTIVSIFVFIVLKFLSINGFTVRWPGQPPHLSQITQWQGLASNTRLQQRQH